MKNKILIAVLLLTVSCKAVKETATTKENTAGLTGTTVSTAALSIDHTKGLTTSTVTSTELSNRDDVEETKIDYEYNPDTKTTYVKTKTTKRTRKVSKDGTKQEHRVDSTYTAAYDSTGTRIADTSATLVRKESTKKKKEFTQSLGYKIGGVIVFIGIVIAIIVYRVKYK